MFPNGFVVAVVVVGGGDGWWAAGGDGGWRWVAVVVDEGGGGGWQVAATVGRWWRCSHHVWVSHPKVTNTKRRTIDAFHHNKTLSNPTSISAAFADGKYQLQVAKRQALVYYIYSPKDKSIMDIKY
ncbi:hypothetical protein L1987_13999 [Smallanthus sonchifolius]|uniref:Uncharacterized protein n=1 Tax=Smallanthus sonchifolius TaxID=185202 RepID=A0ACB9JKA9_9ASTR|nr:hypothetical protein L1987_13999 [Smallanthus sonchifolius]